MKVILCLFLFIVISCSTRQTQQEVFVLGDDILKQSGFFERDLFGVNDYQHDTGMHKFQTDSATIVYGIFSNKFGLQDKHNNPILKPEYSYLALLDDNYLIAEKDNLYGIIDRNGNEIIPMLYRDIYAHKATGKFYFEVRDHKNKQAIFDHFGKEMYPFTINHIESRVEYQGKVFLIIEQEGYHRELLEIENNQLRRPVPYPCSNFRQLKSNLAAFYYNHNSTAYEGFYNMENDSILYGYGKYYYHKPKNEIWTATKKTGYKLYDEVIDSSFTVKANKFDNVVNIVNDYIFLKTEKGRRVMDLQDRILPFEYADIQAFDHAIRADIHGIGWGNFRKGLFKFYTDPNSKKYGIIDYRGKIIVPADQYDEVILADMYDTYSYYNNMSYEKKQYLKQTKFDRIFYTVDRTAPKSKTTMLVTADGDEIITVPTGYYVDLQQFSLHGHLIAKGKDTLKIYDVTSKKIALELTGAVQFEELYPNGYRFHKLDADGKYFDVTYLSNQLNVLYEQRTVRDSLYYKMIKGDKVYFVKVGKTGLIDFNEKEIVPAVYDQITIPNADYNIVKQNGKFGVITNYNKPVLATTYDKIEFQVSAQSFDCWLDGKMNRIYLSELKVK